MEKVKKIGFAALAFVCACGFSAFAQETAEEGTEPITPPPPLIADLEKSKTAPEPETPGTKLLLTPLTSSGLWTMGGSIQTQPAIGELEIAKNPGDGTVKARPQPNSVYYGTPPKSAASIISLGTQGNDIDRFFSTTSFSETGYSGAFGYFGFDKDSLSVGVSRKFTGGAVTSLYYNGNIIEDIFAYISNNSLTNGQVGLGASDGVDGTDYSFMGDLKDRNNINSRTNVGLLFGVGGFGLSIGYSQKLFGLVRKSDAEPEEVGNATNDGVISNAQEALLDNALVPHLEVGFRAGGSKMVFKTTVGFQIDIHQHRELSRGEKITLPGYFSTGTGTYTRDENVTAKLAADYLEPALTLRLEADFPSDNRSRLALGLEVGGRLKMFSNLDDKAETISGIFWSEDRDTGGYLNSVTEAPFDMEILLRPSVRYITRLGERFKIGLSGGFGVGMKFGETTTKTYQWADRTAFMTSDDPYNDTTLSNTITTIPNLDLALYPNLGVGFSIDIVANVFTLNGGIGAVQTLYTIRTGTTEIDIGGAKEKKPLFEQSWGKPLAQFALGATFSFKENFSLDAMFSTNGTAFDDANFAVQFKASF
ncbi:MAG: hypothetical protein LBD20_00760 [Spirochaetaceae bacterium]|jgi:hypothetical protein|nr:hypothetical protein [Spirochaetaceae bacterium]